MKEMEQQALLIENVMFLKRTDLFRPLTLNELVVIIQNIELQEFSSGEFIFSPNIPLKGIYVIHTGSVELVLEGKQGRELPPLILHSRDTIGIVSYYRELPRLKKAKALTDVKAFFIAKDNLSNILEHYPDVQEGIIAELCKIILRYE